MPTYEYECKVCQYRFEKFQSMSDDPLRECPACGGTVRKLIGGGTGIIFKGSGFYVTDSKRGASGASSGSKRASAPESTSKEPGSSEAASTKTEAPAQPVGASKPEGKKESA